METFFTSLAYSFFNLKLSSGHFLPSLPFSTSLMNFSFHFFFHVLLAGSQHRQGHINIFLKLLRLRLTKSLWPSLDYNIEQKTRWGNSSFYFFLSPFKSCCCFMLLQNKKENLLCARVDVRLSMNHNNQHGNVCSTRQRELMRGWERCNKA